MKTSEKLMAVACNPDGEVCIAGTTSDRDVVAEVICDIKNMEKELDKGKWVLAFFEKDTPFLGVTEKDQRVPMLIRANTLTEVMIPKEV